MNTLNNAEESIRDEFDSYADVISRTCSMCDVTKDYPMCVHCGCCHSCCECGKPEGFMRPCEDCHGSGNYYGVDGYYHYCPQCTGTGIHTEDDSFEFNVDEQDWCGAVTAAVLETQQNYILDTQRLILWKDCLSHGQAFILSETGQLAFVIVYCYAIPTDIPDAALAKHEEQLKAGHDYVAMQEARVRRAGPRVEKPNGNIRPEESRMKQK